MEDNYWWHVGLRKLTLSYIDRFGYKQRALRILDAGCGTGGMIKDCLDYAPYGLELSEEAINFCKLRGLDTIVRGSICDTPFKNSFFDIVISLDVLYHKWIDDDLKTLQEFYRIMKSGGVLVVNLPAYNFLLSRHDRAIYTRQRYTRVDLKGKIEYAGFRIERITYRNTILFPFAFIRRIIEKMCSENASKPTSGDLKPLPNPLNRLLVGIIYVENLLIKSGVNFPFGLSVFCIARKR